MSFIEAGDCGEYTIPLTFEHLHSVMDKLRNFIIYHDPRCSDELDIIIKKHCTVIKRK